MPKAGMIPAVPHHKVWLGWIVFLVGILYLIQDYSGAALTWWRVSWPTALFLIAGMAMVGRCMKK